MIILRIIPVLTQLAWARLELGEGARADELLAESRTRTEAASYYLLLVDVLRIEALARMTQSRWREAETALNEALVLCRTMPYPYGAAKALYHWGRLYVARSKPELARAQFEAARTICGQLGERLYRDHIERALAAL